jgi:hypothetical protein
MHGSRGIPSSLRIVTPAQSKHLYTSQQTSLSRVGPRLSIPDATIYGAALSFRRSALSVPVPVLIVPTLLENLPPLSKTR